MFDMSWGELMLIGGVALVVIGPKDLPKALRTVGQVTAKLKRMAGEFHSQFNEAMREAELDEVRREVGEINRSVSSGMSGFNPVQTIRNELKGAVDGSTVRTSYDYDAAPSIPLLSAEPAPAGDPAPVSSLLDAAEPPSLAAGPLTAEPEAPADKPSSETLAAATARLRAAAQARQTAAEPTSPAPSITGQTP
ncbi:MAG: Sec-independent protein translocase protein TatB [Methylobacterium frigidaeris]